jgi:hypothetical protein
MPLLFQLLRCRNDRRSLFAASPLLRRHSGVFASPRRSLSGGGGRSGGDGRSGGGGGGGRALVGTVSLPSRCRRLNRTEARGLDGHDCFEPALSRLLAAPRLVQCALELGEPPRVGGRLALPRCLRCGTLLPLRRAVAHERGEGRACRAVGLHRLRRACHDRHSVIGRGMTASAAATIIAASAAALALAASAVAAIIAASAAVVRGATIAIGDTILHPNVWAVAM